MECNQNLAVLVDTSKRDVMKKSKMAASTDDLRSFEALSSFVIDALSTLDWQSTAMTRLL